MVDCLSFTKLLTIADEKSIVNVLHRTIERLFRDGGYGSEIVTICCLQLPLCSLTIRYTSPAVSWSCSVLLAAINITLSPLPASALSQV